MLNLTIDFANMCDDGFVPGATQCCGIGSCNIFCCKYIAHFYCLTIVATTTNVAAQPIVQKIVPKVSTRYIFLL